MKVCEPAGPSLNRTIVEAGRGVAGSLMLGCAPSPGA